jgi:hypothetical protein
MTKFLISFDGSAMAFPEEELPDRAEVGHPEAKDAGAWAFGGGLKDHEETAVVAPTERSPTARTRRTVLRRLRRRRRALT